jgi:toxin ParE1/3/4
MIYRVEISEQAYADLRSIFEYIAIELGSPQTATGLLSRLEESIIGLMQLPKRFRVYEKEPWYSRGLRIMPVDNFCVFYVPDESDNKVTIIRIMYGGRDIDSELGN